MPSHLDEARAALEEAKAVYNVEKNKVLVATQAVIGSRMVMAVLATLALAFACHGLFAPTRLPSVAPPSAAQIGLPPDLDFGILGEQAREAAAAAQRENVPERVQAIVNEMREGNPQVVPILNWVGFGIAFLLLLGNMWIMTKRRRVSRG